MTIQALKNYTLPLQNATLVFYMNFMDFYGNSLIWFALLSLFD